MHTATVASPGLRDVTTRDLSSSPPHRLPRHQRSESQASVRTVNPLVVRKDDEERDFDAGVNGDSSDEEDDQEERSLSLVDRLSRKADHSTDESAHGLETAFQPSTKQTYSNARTVPSEGLESLSKSLS